MAASPTSELRSPDPRDWGVVVAQVAQGDEAALARFYDGTSRIVLKRESREAAERKARELTDLGWFEVQIDEKVQIEEAERSGKQLRVT